MFATGLTAAIAERFDVPASHVATGTGSVGVLQQLVQASAGEGDEVVYAWRSFEAYPIVVQISGARSVTVPLTAGEHHDLDAMAAAITDRTRLVLVCTPNNPTGTAVRRAELERFLDQVPQRRAGRHRRGVPRVRPRRRGAGRPRGLPRPAERRGAAHVLQGLRAGRAAGRLRGRARAGRRRRCARRPCRSGSAASRRPRRSPRSPPRTSCCERVAALVEERARVQDALREQGWSSVPDSQANFVWLRLGDADRGVRGGLRGGRRRRPPVRGRGRAGDDRRARGQRRLPSGREGLRRLTPGRTLRAADPSDR